MTMRLPKLIAFDLDYTLWDFWVDTHIEPPLHQDPKTGVVYDNSTGYYGREGPSTVEFYGDVPGILKNLRDAGVTIAACSRTSAIKLAMEALKLIRIPNGTEASTENSTNTPTENNGDVSQSWTTTTSPAVKFFDQLEIYPTDKTVHFKELHKKTGLPYSEMLFFDDERRNRNVEKLGVTFILVPEGRGVDNKLFKDGLREWRKRHPEPTPSASDA